MSTTPKTKTRLRVFVTKTGKFRAEFERKSFMLGKVKGACTVGGISWTEDTDLELTPEVRERVRVKCRTIIDTLEAEYQRVFGGKTPCPGRP